MTDFSPLSAFVVLEAVLPLRGKASESSEMVSQLLFGESGTVLTEANNWCQVRRDLDGYEGWVDTKMIQLMDQIPEGLAKGPFVLDGALWIEDGTEMRLPIGVRLPAGIANHQPAFQIGPRPYKISSNIQLTHLRTRASVVATTEIFVNTPYLWGGVSNFGIDCSGLVQTVFRICGVELPRDASQQVACGEAIPWGQQQAGDLAFFSKINQENVTHVGILRDSQYILHASGRVRLDRLFESGIVHSATGQLTHQLISIRRC